MTGEGDQGERLEALLRLCTVGDRVCPQPIQWESFWRLIGAPSSAGVSPPLVLSGWAFSTARSKRAIFESHVRYAASAGLLTAAEAFVASLGDGDWYVRPVDRLDWSYAEALREEYEGKD